MCCCEKHLTFPPQFLFKVEMYFNWVKSPVEFCLPKDTACPVLLRSKLNVMLSDTETKKVSKINFYEDWIDTDERAKYILIELKTNEDLKVI